MKRWEALKIDGERVTRPDSMVGSIVLIVENEYLVCSFPDGLAEVTIPAWAISRRSEPAGPSSCTQAPGPRR